VTDRRRAALRVAAWILGLAAAIAILTLAGRGDLATPPLRSWSAFQAWVDDRGGITAAFAIARLLGLVLAWYLAVVTVTGLVARLVAGGRATSVTDAATVAPVRRLLAGLASAGVASAATLSVAPVVAGALGPHDAGDARPAATASGDKLVRLPDDDVAGDELLLLPGDGAGTATMHRLPDVATWTVQPGDSFWHIAEETLAEAWHRPPTDAEITPYWKSVIDQNRSKLARPGDPDLIFPGQVFELPAPPPLPA
jgi:hypothetical protein